MSRNRAGRKRKSGYRKPSGDIAHAREDMRTPALSWPHRRNLPEPVRLDQKAETPFGGLNLVGAVSDDQYRAGTYYARHTRLYLQVIEAPRIPGSIAGAGEAKGGASYIDPEEASRRKGRYEAAFEALGEAGQKAQRAVARVAVNGHQLEPGELPHLLRGLDTLIRHYGLTAGRKYA